MAAPVVIVGAGLAGLSCSLHLQRPHLLIEAEAAAGGAARTTRRGDYLFDCTGHWLHLRDPSVRDWVHSIVPAAAFAQVQRRAAVVSHGVTTAYPFQAHTYGLPPAVVADCLLEFFAARQRAAAGTLPTPTSFEDYIVQCLGHGIARHFMVPYNRKLWTVHPREMAHAWCGRFVPIPTAEEVVHGALSAAGSGRALGYNASFLYPRAGGIGTLAAACAARLQAPLHLGRRLVAVDWRRRRLRCADGAEQDYDAMVCTMPLTALVAALEDAPAAVRAAAARLRAAQVTYWDVGRARPNAPDDWHWAYFPGPEVPFYRVGSASAVAPYMAPPGHASFCVEVAHPQGVSCPVSDAALVDGLRRVGILAPGESPTQMSRTTLGCAYVIMDHAYGAARQEVLAWLSTQGIMGVGRYGAWMYDSMEGALQAGRDAARRLDG